MDINSAVRLNALSAGYERKVIVGPVDLEIPRGKMTCILGANGSGKTTLLKTVMRIIPELAGEVFILGKDVRQYKAGELARTVAAVLTNRVSIDNVSCFDVAAMGRYPHTGFFGVLSAEDRDMVDSCLEKCEATYLRDKSFSQLSDGERQKVMIARGLAQDTPILILDEPTSHLDIKYKLDVLMTLKRLCVEEEKTVICTLHEPDLAIKCCDQLVLVGGGTIQDSGRVEDVVQRDRLNALYGMRPHQLDTETGTVEFSAVQEQDVFLVGTDAQTPATLRRLTAAMCGLGMGIVQENDVSVHIARAMGGRVFTVPAFSVPDEAVAEEAYQTALGYRCIAVCDFPDCAMTAANRTLVKRLEQAGKKVYRLREHPLDEWLPVLRKS